MAAAVVRLTVIAVRLVWVYPATYLPRWLDPVRGAPGSVSACRASILILGWGGMRGAVSLAAALALPLRHRQSASRSRSAAS